MVIIILPGPFLSSVVLLSSTHVPYFQTRASSLSRALLLPRLHLAHLHRIMPYAIPIPLFLSTPKTSCQHPFFLGLQHDVTCTVFFFLAKVLVMDQILQHLLKVNGP